MFDKTKPAPHTPAQPQTLQCSQITTCCRHLPSTLVNFLTATYSETTIEIKCLSLLSEFDGLLISWLVDCCNSHSHHHPLPSVAAVVEDCIRLPPPPSTKTANCCRCSPQLLTKTAAVTLNHSCQSRLLPLPYAAISSNG